MKQYQLIVSLHHKILGESLTATWAKSMLELLMLPLGLLLLSLRVLDCLINREDRTSSLKQLVQACDVV